MLIQYRRGILGRKISISVDVQYNLTTGDRMIARNIVFLSILMSFGINALADENYDPQSEIEALKRRIQELESSSADQKKSYGTPPVNNLKSNKSSSSNYTRGPRGGCFTYSASGRKKYVDRSLCD
jgi:hypothetical protein